MKNKGLVNQTQDILRLAQNRPEIEFANKRLNTTFESKSPEDKR